MKFLPPTLSKCFGALLLITATVDPSVAQSPPLFAAVGPMNASRWVHAETVLDQNVLVTGGSFQLAGEFFNPVTNTFTPLSSGAPTDRVYGTATPLPDGKVLLIGGTDGNGPLDTAEIFDPGTTTSRAIAARMNTPRYGHAATHAGPGQVLLCGGQDSSGILNTAELFDRTTETFSPVAGNMSVPRIGHTATALPNGKVLITGGFSGDSVSASADLFDPATGTFVALGIPMHSARYGHTATVMFSGKVLIVGGWDGTRALGSAELFDPATQTFALVSNTMTSPREAHTATDLDNGFVFIAGGDSDGQTPVSSVDLFNPSSETFIPIDVGNMTTPRRLHSAARLRDSRVLLTGGYGNGQAFNSAELFYCPPVFGPFLPAAVTTEAVGPEGVTVHFGLPWAKDLAGHNLTVDCTPAPDSLFPLGTTAVTLTAVDGAGVSSTTTFNVTVVDTTAPVIMVPTDITAKKQKLPKRYKKPGALVSFSISATDSVDGSVIATAIPASGSFFPVGTTMVLVNAIDSHGNQSQAQFDVTVVKPKRH